MTNCFLRLTLQDVFCNIQGNKSFDCSEEPSALFLSDCFPTLPHPTLLGSSSPSPGQGGGGRTSWQGPGLSAVLAHLALLGGAFRMPSRQFRLRVFVIPHGSESKDRVLMPGFLGEFCAAETEVSLASFRSPRTGGGILDARQFLAIEPMLEWKRMAYMLSICNGGCGATSTYLPIHPYTHKQK